MMNTDMFATIQEMEIEEPQEQPLQQTQQQHQQDLSYFNKQEEPPESCGNSGNPPAQLQQHQQQKVYQSFRETLPVYSSLIIVGISFWCAKGIGHFVSHLVVQMASKVLIVH
jgi:hypothetical protein